MEKPRSSINDFLMKASTDKTFEPQHKNKGRYRKNSTKLTLKQQKLIKGWLEDGKTTSSRQCWLRLCNIRNTPQVSYNTVIKYVKKLGQFLIPKLKSVLSNKNKELRFQHCQKYLNKNLDDVLWTDESTFILNQNTQKIFVSKGSTKPTKTKFNPNYSVMVWGGISTFGKTPLILVEGWQDGPKYQNLIESNKTRIKKMFGRKKWRFQQDNAKCHTAPQSISCIKKHLTTSLFPHPPQSPDLNPIELIWAKMKRLVQTYDPKNKRELVDAIMKSWEKIGKRFIIRCIRHLRKNMKKCIEKNGGIM